MPICLQNTSVIHHLRSLLSAASIVYCLCEARGLRSPDAYSLMPDSLRDPHIAALDLLILR